MPKVIVKEIPVRYENKTYRKGETFDMKVEHVNDSLVTVVDEPKKKNGKGDGK